MTAVCHSTAWQPYSAIDQILRTPHEGDDPLVLRDALGRLHPAGGLAESDHGVVRIEDVERRRILGRVRESTERCGHRLADARIRLVGDPLEERIE